MTNSISKWQPIDGNTEEMFVKSLQDNCDGLKIFLHNIAETLNISIAFTEPLSYRNTDESYLLKLWDSLEEGELKGSFYIYKKSAFIDNFNDMTHGIYKDLEIKHYAIYTDSDCIDILSVKEPLIVTYI